jgi:hypothetical protein
MQETLRRRSRRAPEQPVDPGADGTTGESTSGSRCADTAALLSRIDEVLASV